MTEAPTGVRWRRRLRVVRPRAAPLAECGWALATMAAALLAFAITTELWNAHLHVPFLYGGDAIQTEIPIKALVEHGWFFTNPHMGAPFGQQFYDFPWSDSDLSWVLIKILSIGTSDPALILNAFYVLTYPITALVAFLVMRSLGVSRPSAAVVSVLFALAPYHLINSEQHIFLDMYVAVPLAAWLALRVLEGRSWLTRRKGAEGGLLAYASRGSALTATVCIVIGSTGLYYAAFAILLTATAAAVAGVGARSWRTAVVALALPVLIGATVLLNFLPSLLYGFRHGANLVASARRPEESEFYGLKFAQMVLPVAGHRLSALRNLTQEYISTTPLKSEGAQQAIGSVATAGLVWLLVFALMSCAGVVRSDTFQRHRHVASLAVTCLIVGTVGGVSAVVAYVLTAQIRAWNRISIEIAFLGLIAIALGLEALRKRVGHKRRWLWAGLLAVVLVGGTLDQTNSQLVPAYVTAARSYASDAGFVHAIEATLPRDAMIYELPYVPFPEAGAAPDGSARDYDLARGYLHSKSLRWSYGAVKGRPTDWSASASQLSVPTQLEDVAAAGFDGLWIDRFGYTDGGQAVETEVAGTLHSYPRASADRRFLFFDLRAYAQRVRARLGGAGVERVRTATLYPVTPSFGPGFYTAEQNASDTWHWAYQHADIDLDNPWTRPQREDLTATVKTDGVTGRHVVVRFPDGTTRHLTVPAAGVRLRQVFTVPAGASTVSFDSDAHVTPAPGDTRRLSFRLVDAHLATDTR